MIDVALALRTWLLLPSVSIGGQVQTNQVPVILNAAFVTGGAFPNNTPDRIYVGHLVTGFDPKYGPGIVIRVGSGTTTGTGGGSSHPEIPLTMPRVQMTVFAGIQQYQVARRVYRAAYDWMNRQTNIDLGIDSDGNEMYMLSAIEQVEGQDVDEAHTGFATNISFWKFMFRE